jgi:hypothetical protein
VLFYGFLSSPNVASTRQLFIMNRYNLLCIIYASFGAFFYGYDSGLTTSIIGYPEFIAYFKFDATTLGVLGSAYYAVRS